MADKFPSKQLDQFYKAASSLKLFSRAELSDDKDRTLIEKLYVDPLPNDQVYKTLLSENTTFIIGRKGTGKSTVFQRVQHEIRKNRSNVISAYMDIRNVYESSQIDPDFVSRTGGIQDSLSPAQIQKLLLHKRFMRTLISEIRTELKSQIEKSFLSRIKDRVRGTSEEIFAGLDTIIANLEAANFEDIAGIVKIEGHDKSGTKKNKKLSGSTDLNISADKPSLGIKGGVEIDNEYTNEIDSTYSQILMRIIGINSIIDEIRSVLDAIGIKYLYIFLDDFSELPEESMQLLVDTLISPLARWGDFIKFKIAAYPGRVYLGSLDKTKIEELYLDTYQLYGSGGVTKMEEKATEFVERLVTRRIDVFCKTTPDLYFNTSIKDIWKTLFYATMGNPRILGHIMLYTYESHLLYGKKIGVAAIQDASQRYYEEKVATFFSTGRYRTSFHERSSIFSLKELLEKIVTNARDLRQEDRTRDKKESRGRVFSSHFYVSQNFDDLLTSLELSFFISKYFEQSDRAGTRVSIYALNYGLCNKYQIGFGRPIDRREDRLYFVDRIFDYNAVMRTYVVENQEISCDSCKEHYDAAMLQALTMMHMKCPKCTKGTCKVINISRKYGDLLDSIKPELLLPEAELGILHTLFTEKREMVASEIAAELDCSGQLVGRRARKLSEQTLVLREQAGPIFRYLITPQAEAAYFSDTSSADLDL